MTMPALDHLMGAYLHQDFDLYGDAPMDAVDAFLQDEPDLAQPLASEIDALLASQPTEQEIERTVFDLGCQVYPDKGFTGYRPWLAAIADRARRHQG